MLMAVTSPLEVLDNFSDPFFMKSFPIFSLCVFWIVPSVGGQGVADKNPNSPVDAIVPSDFFIDALKSAKDDSNDPMGTQRLIQVKDSSITPVVTASSAFKYTSNPDKIKNPTRDDGTTLDLTLSLNVGLGEYGIGDDILAVPAFSFMQMRTFTDPIREYGDDMQAFDVDVQVIGFSLPFVLPDDFTLTIGHSYVAPSTFRGKNQLISYSNTPSITFAKNIPLDWGDVLSVSVGASYTFSQGDSLQEQIADPTYFNFLKAVMEQSGTSPSSEYPANLQSGLGHTINFSYMSPVGEKLTLIPSFTYNNMMFSEGSFKNRSDKTYNLCLVSSYAVYDWLNATAMSNYTWKTSSDNVSEFEDFIGGVSLGVSHAF